MPPEPSTSPSRSPTLAVWVAELGGGLGHHILTPLSFPAHFLLLRKKQNCSVNIKVLLSLVIFPYTNFIKPISFTVAREKAHDQE